jgi:CTP:molybdopterin cytidylyltransferase MocA
MIPAIILAAGASRRLGKPKQLVSLDGTASGETLLERAVRVAREADLAPIIVVLGADHSLILAHSSLGDAVPVINDEWQEGMASSIRLGIRTCRLIAKDAEGVLLMPCDQPAVTAHHLNLVASRATITASEYAGRKGIPAYFPAAHWETLLALHGDTGARDLLREARCINLPHGELDVDTPADLERAQTLFGKTAKPLQA